MQIIREAVKDNMKDKEESTTSPFNFSKGSPYKANWFEQFWALNKRAFIEMSREPMLLRIKIVQTIVRIQYHSLKQN